jgi:hypothetical protein
MPTTRRGDYPQVGMVTDPAAQQTIRLLWDRVQKIQADHDTLQAAHDTLATSVTTLTAASAATMRQVQAFRVVATPPATRGVPPPDTGGTTPPVVTGGPDTTDVLAIINATAAQYSNLTQIFDTDDAATAAAQELLLRIIWHLQVGGFNAGRQKNPSGAISNDKITVFLAAAWHAYDIFTLGYAGHATTVHLFEIGGPNTVPETGIAD